MPTSSKAESVKTSQRTFCQRPKLIVVGVIEQQDFEPTTQFRARVDGKYGPDDDWRILRRRIRVESVLFGSEPRQEIDVYEVFPTGPLVGNWNSTREGDRNLFPLREEDGYYRLLGDFWSSIFPVTTGPHDRLPLDDSRPLWERIALMNWWLPSNPTAQITYTEFLYSDPADALSLWRKVKLERGLLHHPSSQVRVPACLELLDLFGWGQDECWEMLSDSEREHIRDGGYTCCTAEEVYARRAGIEQTGAAYYWTGHNRDERRIFTTINNRRIRTEICRLYNAEYPGDTDTGCPADRPPPATIVTAQGDIPLIGDWPR